MSWKTAVTEPLSDLIQFGEELARAARHETLTRFSRGCEVENKAGNGQFDPVTQADRAAEVAMRELIVARFPAHGIEGEEFQDRPAEGPFCWSLDPIDGTRSYLSGLPSWVTLIGLLKDGQPIAGLIDSPCLDELYVGVAGLAFLKRRGIEESLKTSGCTALDEARLSTTDPYLFASNAQQSLKRLLDSTRTVRFGYDGYAYARLAAGTLDLIVECSLKPHDYNALIPVVRGAGGVFGDWLGGSDFRSGNVIAAATGELYQSAVSIMRDCA